MLRQAASLLIETFRNFTEDYCSTMAAALAFYALFAAPALMLAGLFTVAAVYGHAGAVGRLQTQLAHQFGSQTAAILGSMISAASRSRNRSTFGSVIAFGSLAVSAIFAVSQLQQALNKAWDIELDQYRVRSFIIKRAGSFLLIAGAAILLIVSLAALPAFADFRKSLSAPAAGLAYAGEILFWWVVFALIIAAILKVLPDARIALNDVRIGATVTSALIVAGRFLIAEYLGRASFSTPYGAAGSIAVLLLWAYYSAAVFLMGVEFTQVWTRFSGRMIEPEPGALRIVERATKFERSPGRVRAERKIRPSV
jgi:membrane protein